MEKTFDLTDKNIVTISGGTAIFDKDKDFKFSIEGLGNTGSWDIPPEIEGVRLLRRVIGSAIDWTLKFETPIPEVSLTYLATGPHALDWVAADGSALHREFPTIDDAKLRVAHWNAGSAGISAIKFGTTGHSGQVVFFKTLVVNT
jgi:hypothetical protein